MLNTYFCFFKTAKDNTMRHIKTAAMRFALRGLLLAATIVAAIPFSKGATGFYSYIYVPEANLD